METSQDIVSCYPVNHMLLDLAWWRNSRSVGLRSDYEGHQSKEASKELKILFIGIVYKATWKAMKKKHSSNCFVAQHFFTWERDQKFIYFDLQWEEESDFLYAVAIQAGQKFQSKLRRKQIFVIFNDCQDMLQIVDEIISWPFPVNRVFNQRLTNFEVGLILRQICKWEICKNMQKYVLQWPLASGP